MAIDYGTLADRLLQGYQFGSNISDKKKAEAEKAKKESAAAELATALATGFDSAPKVDQQAEMLKEQTAGMEGGDGQDTAIPAAAGPSTKPKAPPGPYKAVNDPEKSAIPAIPDNVGKAESATPPEPDPRIQELEAMVTKEQGSPIMKQQNWKDYEQTLMEKAGAIGDPDTVVKVRQYLNDMKATGMKQNLTNAKAAMLGGDDKAANHYVQRAWGYMADGNIPQLMPVGNGKYVATVVDENTGKPSAPPTAINADILDQMIMLAESPAEFAKFTQMQEEKLLDKGTPEERKAARKAAAEKTQIELETATANRDKAKWQAKKEEVAANKPDGYTQQQWDAKVNELNSHITNTYQKSDEFADIPEAQIPELRKHAEAILTNDRTMSVANAARLAKMVVLATDPATGQPPVYKVYKGDVYVQGEGGKAVPLSELIGG